MEFGKKHLYLFKIFKSDLQPDNLYKIQVPKHIYKLNKSFAKKNARKNFQIKIIFLLNNVLYLIIIILDLRHYINVRMGGFGSYITLKKKIDS